MLATKMKISNLPLYNPESCEQTYDKTSKSCESLGENYIKTADIDICITFIHNIFINPNIKCTEVTRIQWTYSRLFFEVVNNTKILTKCLKMCPLQFQIPKHQF